MNVEAKTIEVIRTESLRGCGRDGHGIARNVTHYHHLDGRLLHVDDPSASRRYGVIVGMDREAHTITLDMSGQWWADDLDGVLAPHLNAGVMVEYTP